MNTEQRLRAALESRAATAAPSPDALAEIRRRSDRRRWAGRFQVGFAAAAVAGVAAGAFALVDTEPDRSPVPPTTGETTTPAPSPSPSPSASASAAAAPQPLGRDEFVAVLRGGDIVVMSASDGRIVRSVLSGVVSPQDPAETLLDASVTITLAPDRRAAYLATRDVSGDCAAIEGTIDRVDLATGERTRVAAGHEPDVSPDGARLVYVAGCAEETVVVRDLRTGAEQRFRHVESPPDAQGDPTSPWMLDRAVWHADGTRLWVSLHWESSTDLRLLDPASDRTTADAQPVGTRHGTFGLERNGSGLVYLHTCCYAEELGDNSVVMRSADGVERVLVRAPHTERLGMVDPGPDGDLLYMRGGRLYRIGAGDGSPRDLGASTALARDW